MTEDQRRWRGYHLLETMCNHIRGHIDWHPITTPLHPKPTRGLYDPAKGWYDQTAGPKDHIPGPRITFVEIPHIPNIHPGEVITLTPHSLTTSRRDLHKAELWDAVTDYAAGVATYKIAAWWPSDQRIRWSRAAPKALRDACLLMADREPMNANHIRAYQQIGQQHLTNEPGQNDEKEPSITTKTCGQEQKVLV